MTEKENEITEDKAKKKFEHVALSEASTQKLDHWLEQVNAKKKIRIPRKELLNWWIARSPDNLSNSELNALIEEFYDEEAFLRQLLRDVKKARKDGLTDPTLEVVVKPRKTDQKKEAEAVDKNDEV